MDTRKFLKTLLGILLGIGALCLGSGFWAYFTHGVFIVIPFMLGYIYIAINLSMLKKWAWQVFFFIVAIATIMETLFVLLGGVKEGLVEWFFILIVINGSVIMTVFGISALVRMIRRRIKG